MRNPVTVIIPVKDRPNDLDKAVASVLPQLLPSDEVLVVDDGSQPPAKVAVDDERIRIVRLSRSKGPAGARNVGVAEAANEVLAFVDSDDLWLEGKLAAQLGLLDRDSALTAIVSGWRELVDGAPFRNRIPVPAVDPSDHFEGCWFCPGTTLVIRKSAFEQCGPFNETIRRLEDYEWFLRFAQQGGRLAVADGHYAVINRGRNNKPELVEAAVSHIRANYEAGLGQAARNGMMAYLHLELAGAYRNAARYPRMVRHIFTSLWYRPRLRIQLRNWWK